MAKDLAPPIASRAVRRLKERRRLDTSRQDGTAGVQRREYGAGFYDAAFESGDRWTLPYWQMQWYASWVVIADRITHLTDPKVLDVGCGPGHLARLLCDRGVTSFTGFDFSERRALFARELVPEFRFEIADAYTTDLFETCEYDIVTCCEVLEHVEGDLGILERIRGGTRVLGTVPNHDGESHVRYFTDESAVLNRYGRLLADLRVDRIHNTTSTSVFLFDGYLK